MNSARYRVMADYGASGIWTIDSVGPFRPGVVEISAIRPPLPQALQRRFEKWSERYWDRLRHTFDCAPFNDEGWALARLLQEHLGGRRRVVYVGEHSSGSLCAEREVIVEDELPEGWVFPSHAGNLELELRRELSEAHPLWEERTWPFAQSIAADETIFAVEAREWAWALVHLTWSKHREKPPWPTTVLCEDWAAVERAVARVRD